MKVIFLGTPEFAVNILKGIVESHHKVVAVVCQPSKPTGRGNKIQDPPVKTYADLNNIPVYQFNKISKEGVDVLRSLNADIMVTAAYGQILSKEVLEITPKGVINVHGSLLPKYRGSSPIQWAILNGEKETGITIMKTDVGIDDGDMLMSESCLIDENETDLTLFNKLAEIGKVLIVKSLDLIEENKAVFKEQGKDFTYFPMIKKEMAKIDFSKPGHEIDNMVRAFNSWPVAHFNIGTDTFKVFKVSYQKTEINGEFGQVIQASSKQGLVVNCGDGILEIVELQAPNGKRMRAKDYLNGKKIEIGTILN